MDIFDCLNYWSIFVSRLFEWYWIYVWFGLWSMIARIDLHLASVVICLSVFIDLIWIAYSQKTTHICCCFGAIYLSSYVCD